MANSTSSPTAVAVAIHQSKRPQSLIFAFAPVLLLVLAMAGMRLLPSEETTDALPELPKLRMRRNYTPPVPLTTADQEEIKRLTNAQLESIRRNDYAKALSFSAPPFREQTSPDQFRLMIRHRYSDISRSIRHYFRSPQSTISGASMFVVVQDPKGAQAGFFYLFAKEGDHWGITGCSPATMFDSPHKQRLHRSDLGGNGAYSYGATGSLH